MCANNVRIDYQPEGGSEMMHAVSDTTATSAILSNLQCDTEYTISVHARSGLNNKTSVTRMFFLPARGMNNVHVQSYNLL